MSQNTLFSETNNETPENGEKTKKFKPLEEMETHQQRAYTLYLDSATSENGFVPASDTEISKQLKSEGVEPNSSSAIQRWRNTFGWETYLKSKIDRVLGDDPGIKNSAANNVVTKEKEDVETLNELLGLGAGILLHQLKYYKQKIEQGAYLQIKELEVVMKITQMSGARLDRVYDRQTFRDALGAEDARQTILGGLDRFLNAGFEQTATGEIIDAFPEESGSDEDNDGEMLLLGLMGEEINLDDGAVSEDGEPLLDEDEEAEEGLYEEDHDDDGFQDDA